MPSDALKQIENGRFFLIAGPCVIESEKLCLTVAEKIAKLCAKHKLLFIFKASYSKANRLSAKSYSGPGMNQGLKALAKVKKEFGVPVLTDVHESVEVDRAAEVADILQIPAFLCRQTELIQKAAATGKWLNIKKGQFLAPEDMKLLAEKAGTKKVMLTERGTTFGYRNLVVDFRSLLIMKQTGLPVVFDATHSLQLPGAGGTTSSGQPEYSIPMAVAAATFGINGIFVETHPNPKEARSDSGAMLPLSKMPELVESCLRVREKILG
jgi:2-dehydro-3-deoxyphosphooctonate aldolase (KDO 8-P synthase)